MYRSGFKHAWVLLALLILLINAGPASAAEEYPLKGIESALGQGHPLRIPPEDSLVEVAVIAGQGRRRSAETEDGIFGDGRPVPDTLEEVHQDSHECDGGHRLLLQDYLDPFGQEDRLCAILHPSG